MDKHFKTRTNTRSGAQECGRRRQIDPVCRILVTRHDDLEPAAARGLAATNDGPVKRRRLGQICVGVYTQ